MANNQKNPHPAVPEGDETYQDARRRADERTKIDRLQTEVEHLKRTRTPQQRHGMAAALQWEREHWERRRTFALERERAADSEAEQPSGIFSRIREALVQAGVAKHDGGRLQPIIKKRALHWIWAQSGLREARLSLKDYAAWFGLTARVLSKKPSTNTDPPKLDRETATSAIEAVRAIIKKQSLVK